MSSDGLMRIGHASKAQPLPQPGAQAFSPGEGSSSLALLAAETADSACNKYELDLATGEDGRQLR
jgi:hypothetical protein